MRNHARGSPQANLHQRNACNVNKTIGASGGHHIAFGSGVKIIQGNSTEILAGAGTIAG